MVIRLFAKNTLPWLVGWSQWGEGGGGQRMWSTSFFSPSSFVVSKWKLLLMFYETSPSTSSSSSTSVVGPYLCLSSLPKNEDEVHVPASSSIYGGGGEGFDEEQGWSPSLKALNDYCWIFNRKAIGDGKFSQFTLKLLLFFSVPQCRTKIQTPRVLT